jgi:hypothetical protein
MCEIEGRKAIKSFESSYQDQYNASINIGQERWTDFGSLGDTLGTV